MVEDRGRMALRSAPPWLLALLAVALRDSCVGASSHSLKYFATAISEPSQGQPHFVQVVFVDGQVFDHYDSNSRKRQPRVSWMEKVGKDHLQYWERKTQRVRGIEDLFRRNLETLMNLYNQSEGSNILLGSVPSVEKDTGFMEVAWKEGLMVDRSTWHGSEQKRGIRCFQMLVRRKRGRG